jgi:hypothetical protein
LRSASRRTVPVGGSWNDSVQRQWIAAAKAMSKAVVFKRPDFISVLEW